MRILIFDDAFSLNGYILFENEILLEMPDISIKSAHNFYAFEKELKLGNFRAIILDIMGADTKISSIENGEKILSDFLGIEMLQRIRSGLYPKQDKDVVIIMRTARADEPDICSLCIAEGANYIFPPGEFDSQIIEILQAISIKFHENHSTNNA
ncbi:MAG: hypothetical protein WC755_08580 [Candidatus Woesearchaeota archaeon]|jgi:DNA-binding response OmpR family regulator